MIMSERRYRYSGIPPDGDPMHYELPREFSWLASHSIETERRAALDTLALTKGVVIAPDYVTIPGGRTIPQWSPTISSKVCGFRPASDCTGNFTSSKFQPNNNCYNYACNIATNTFAQPGRKHGLIVKRPDGPKGPEVIKAAMSDGLKLIGGRETTLRMLPWSECDVGHIVALFISDAYVSHGWHGDYHWVRCDDPDSPSWSHKNGPDTATPFDFAGVPISDPSRANWTVNLGPRSNKSRSEVEVVYEFEAWRIGR